MADDKAAAETKAVGDRFPALKQLEEDVERAKLDQALVEARSKALAAKVPNLEVELGQDTVTQAEKTTGLARVLVQQCSSVLADDVAGLALDAARRATNPDPNKQRRYIIRIIDNPETVRDVDLFRTLDEELTLLAARIDDYAPESEAPDGEGDGDGDGEADGEVQDAALPLVPAAAIVGLGVQAVGLVSKLLARSYQVSGVEVAVDDLGFDLLLAKRLDDQLKEDEKLRVEVDRLLVTPNAQILDRVWKLAAAADQRVAPVLAAAAASHAETEAAQTADETAVTALDAQILELTKRVTDAEDGAEPDDVAGRLAELNEERTGLIEGLPDRRGAVAEAREHHHRGTALVKDVEAFIIEALTAPDKGRAPIMRAARVEAWAAQSDGQDKDAYTTYLLFARLVAGGVDRTIETKVGADRWSSLSGTTVEFAVLDADGELCDSGVRSVLHAWEMKLGDPEDAKDFRPKYAPVEREPDDQEDGASSTT
jgi:hypothetical protein